MYGIRGVSKEEMGLYRGYRRLQVVFSAPKNPILKFLFPKLQPFVLRAIMRNT